MGHERVTGLVVGENPLLLLGHDATGLQAGDDPLHRRFEVGVADVLLLGPSREDGGLVAHVGEVGAREAGRLTRDDFKVDVGSEFPPRVHAEDRLAAGEIGRGDEDLPVEATGTKEGGVEVLQAVRRRDDDDTVGLEPVELDEQLIQRLDRARG